MLRMYLMDKPGKWEAYLHLLEFFYNNNFHVPTGMSPFEFFYGHKCNSLISWRSTIDRLILGPELLKYMELAVKQVHRNLRTS